MTSLRAKVQRRLTVLKQVWQADDILLFLRIFAFASAVPGLLRLKQARLRTLLAPKRALRTPKPGEVQKIVDFVEAALILGKPLVRSKCYTRGLTRYYFLNRAGVDVSLYFGVEQFAGALAGHCWLVKDGEPFLETPDPRPVYAPVFCFPGARESVQTESQPTV